MLKFILLALVLILLVRLVLKLLGRSFFIRYRVDLPGKGSGRVSRPDFRKKTEDADYEVIGTQLRESDSSSRKEA